MNKAEVARRTLEAEKIAGNRFGTEEAERTEEAQEAVQRRFGKNQRYLAVMPGTGWGEGVERVFQEEDRMLYKDLNIPGTENEVPGHEKSMKVGTIDGRAAMILGRVHGNEDSTNPELRHAMDMVIGSVSEVLDGLIITNGVGSLHGRVWREQGLIKSMLMTAILDTLGWTVRGRRQEVANVGDIVVVDTIKTALLGSFTPLGAGDFIDFHHNGIHRDDNRFFNLARSAVEQVQGRAPRAQGRLIAGPQFESLADKIESRAMGDDIIGMSGLQEALIATRRDIAFALLALVTNGPFAPHSHEGNQETGRKNEAKASEILRILAHTWPKKAA